jgi:EmrB/QacA subfamily drug resistance transporter
VSVSNGSAGQAPGAARRRLGVNADHDSYKWWALSCTSVGMLLATINSGTLIIALPNLERSLHTSLLELVWVILVYMIASTVLVLSAGRLSDQFGRKRAYVGGFVLFAAASLGAGFAANGTELILWRIVQGVGGAFLFANSSAILTDAFPENERGKAMGINGVALVTGSFLGLILGGVLAPIDWRLVFLVSVPFGIFGTVWAYLMLKDNGVRIKSSLDWLGNITFAIGLIALLTGIVYGIQPYGGHTMGWTNPGVLGAVFGGLLFLVAFVIIETKVENPMFQLHLFRIRAFTTGIIASLLSALGRGGLQFMLIIWLQGIWLPQHGYNFSQTPLWAGIYLIPLTIGFLLSGPASGIFADRHGARAIATIGLIGAGICYLLLETLPMNFNYWPFAVIVLFFSIFSGMFFSPNQMAVMNSLPAEQRGAGGGMNATFMNSAQVLSIGVFFSIVTLGLAASLPGQLLHGLLAEGVPNAQAQKLSHLPPIGSLFAAFLGFNPIQTEVPHQVLAHLGHARAVYLTGRSFFPKLIAPAFENGLHLAFDFAAATTFIAAIASWLRGGRYIHGTASAIDEAGLGTLEVGELASAEIGAGVMSDR